mgnify:CR=1 FL=1
MRPDGACQLFSVGTYQLSTKENGKTRWGTAFVLGSLRSRRFFLILATRFFLILANSFLLARTHSKNDAGTVP